MVSAPTPPSPDTPHAKLQHSLATAYWMHRIHQHKDVHAVLQPKKAGKKTQAVHLEHLQTATAKATLLKLMLTETQAPIVVICPDAPSVLNIYAALEPCFQSSFAFQEQVHRYPTDVFSPYDMTRIPCPVLNEHYAFLHDLQAEKAGIYLVQARNLIPTFPSLDYLQSEGLSLKEGDEQDIEEAVERLIAMGYTPKDLVQTVGEFSRRGDLLDIYPVNASPVRLSFFGDSVENIRLMDVETQRSVEKIGGVTVFPIDTLVLTQERKEALEPLLLKALKAHSKKIDDKNNLDGLAENINQQLQSIEQGVVPDDLNYYAPFFKVPFHNLTQYLTKSSILVLDDWQEAIVQMENLDARFASQYDKGITQGHLLDLGAKADQYPLHASANVISRALHQPSSHRLMYTYAHHALTPDTALTDIEQVTLQNPLKAEVVHRFQAKLDEAIVAMKEWRKDGVQIWVATDYPQRLLDLCREADLPTQYWADVYDPENPVQEARLKKSLDGLEIIICKTALNDGVFLPHLKMIYLTDAELFGRGRVRRTQSERQNKHKRDQDRAINSLSDLKPNDYVVHHKHGIGQFVELKQIVMETEKREYLEIQYRGNDRLFLPVEQLHLLARFNGTGDVKPVLSKMGGAEWRRVTAKVKNSIQNIANELVALYKARQEVKGISFEPDTPWQVEMEEAFPFEETPDQWKAILDTKKDMEHHLPMDRLICGDVGFGKTEVALRALFKCVMSGRQTAFLVPTTILAQQHFNTVSERLAPWGVRVGLLSRFKTPREQKETLIKMKAGEIDILVGTHRLLQKDIIFKDLGLLVIDEEHRFGVAHKERIKQMRTNVDVLSMSATPIPRTLHMSLSGVREMSLINTAPVNRLPVQTRVGGFNPAQLRMAILHELDRGGQIYYLHNRVQSIYDRCAELEKIVPEARVRVAHGQMPPNELETAMLDFANKQFDILVATTIIESGVDIPNANTLIIDDADRYGLAQLYQIRGRVGRSDVQAYAYLYHDANKVLTEDAKNRLRAIREFTALGSGYQIAMRDMEIRGVGNLLGAEQHGHMMQIGFEMYCELLNQAVEAAHKGERLEEQTQEPAVIDLNITAFIPEPYVGSRDVKLQEYRRLAAAKSETQLDLIVAEWQDRFGKVPAPAKQLVHLARLRVQSTELDIPLVRTDEEQLKISVPYGLKQWMHLQQLLPVGIAPKLRWVAPAKSNEGHSFATLHFKHMGASGERLLQFVTELFKALLDLKKKGKLDEAVSASAQNERYTGGRASVKTTAVEEAKSQANRDKSLAASEARTAARFRSLRGY
ncbi:MAG: transcription-repair coupling factor [Vampirovibrionales bacterium]